MQAWVVATLAQSHCFSFACGSHTVTAPSSLHYFQKLPYYYFSLYLSIMPPIRYYKIFAFVILVSSCFLESSNWYSRLFDFSLADVIMGQFCSLNLLSPLCVVLLTFVRLKVTNARYRIDWQRCYSLAGMHAVIFQLKLTSHNFCHCLTPW